MLALLTNKRGERRGRPQVYLRRFSFLFVLVLLLVSSSTVYFPAWGTLEMEQWELSQEGEKEGESQEQNELKEKRNIDDYLPLAQFLTDRLLGSAAAPDCRHHGGIETYREVFTPPPQWS